MTGVTIEDVANYFLTCIDRETGSIMTHLKLQKLVFYAQAWHLAFDDESLFDDDFQAWVHGPVNPSLFAKYKKYGFDALPGAPKRFNAKKVFSESQLETLRVVWEAYGKFDAKYLEELTHQESPWRDTREGLEPWQACTRVIPKAKMRDFYKSLLDGEE